MIVVKPITIGATNIATCNVPENDYAEYSDTAVYSIGDRCIVSTPYTKTATITSNYIQYHRGNFTAGNAFFVAAGTDLSDFAGTDTGYAYFRLTLTDTGGKTAIGYVAGGGAGERLGNNLISNSGFSKPGTPWVAGTGWVIDARAKANSPVNTSCYQSCGITTLRLYKSSIKVVNRVAGTVSMWYGSETNTFNARSSAGTFTEYAASDGASTNAGFIGAGFEGILDNVLIQEVLEPPLAADGGLHIVSTPNGTTRDWASIDAGFNPAAIATYLLELSEAYTHCVYESLESSNVGYFPPTNVISDSPKWLEVRKTNRCLVFDSRLTSQTERSTSISYTLSVPASIDSLVLIGLDATNITVQQTDPSTGVAYSRTLTLSTSQRNAVLLDLSTNASAALSITINRDGTAKCGEIIIGNQQFIGHLRYGVTMAVTDYSVKEVDDFGNWFFVERAVSDRNTYPLFTESSSLDSVAQFLMDNRATPLVFTHEYSSVFSTSAEDPFLTCGFFKDLVFEIEEGGDIVYSEIEVEGLV